MNFAEVPLDNDTVAFWKGCRAFFEEHVTKEVLDEERQTGGGFNEALHLALGKRGWVAPEWPVEEGGAGLDEVRARIVAKEYARSGAPFILASTTLLPPVAIRMFGSAALRAEVLPGIAAGTIRVCLGYTEPDCGSDLAAVRTRAVRDGDGWVITGQKMFTTGAQFAQYCFCLARTNPDLAKHKGLTVFLVPLDSSGVEIRPIGTVGGERSNFVHFDDVHVLDHYRVGDVDQGWTVVSAPLAAEHGMGDEGGGAEDGGPYVHMTRQLLDAACGILRDRARDDQRSRPGDLERLGRVLVDIELAEALPAALRRTVSAEGLARAASDLLEFIGPVGVLAHGAAGALAHGIAEYGYRYAPGTSIYGGSTDIQRNVLAEQMLGLPRSTPRG